MQTMHPTLLIGPADWDAIVLPRVEFAERLAGLWCEHAQAAGAIVYGNARDHAALAYLTHFTPKLEAALALIPRTGAPRLLIGGGVNMMPAARPLTFVADLAPLRGADRTTADWARDLPAGPLLLIGGEAMPYALRSALAAALGAERALIDGDATLRARMRVKRPREIAALREACMTLDHAVTALQEAFRAGRGVTDGVLAAEHRAIERGAQDVRSLFSLDRGMRLQPFEVPVPHRVDPLQVYLAVRQAGYWAEAFVCCAARSDALQAAARRILEATIAAVRPGQRCRTLWQTVEASRGDFDLHPLSQSVLGSSIGLALDEQPLLTRDSDAEFAPGEVYALRAGVSDGGAGALASAMLVVTERGCEAIWRTQEQS